MIGTTLSHYLIEAELGRGGMGIVYRGKDTKLDRTVAIKVLPSAALATDEDRARFYREAKSAAALNHPNIAAVYQIDEAVPSDAPHGTQPSPFIAMEFIEGETLEARIKKGPLKLGEAVELAKQIADGLKAAHAKDIVHRDIKAANVMLDADGRAKILDFGLALTSQSTKLTRMGSTLGTVAYMSPEQARGEEVDSRTDLWALGVVLYEMISGVNPFGGDYEQAVVYGILNSDPEPLTALRTGVPMELERITNKALSKDASRRYQTAADLIGDLSGVEIGTASSSLRTSTIPNSHTSNRAGLSQRTWISAAVVGCVLLGAMYFVGKSSVPATPPPKTMKVQINTGSVEVIDRVVISEDGSFIGFSGKDTTTMETGLYIYETATALLKRVSNSGDYFRLTISPDNKWIVMISYTESAKLLMQSIETGKPTRISADYVQGWVSPTVLLMVPFDGPMYSMTLDGEVLDTFDLEADKEEERGVNIYSVLPGGRYALASFFNRNDASRDFGVYDMKKKAIHSILIQDDKSILSVKFLKSGHLVLKKNWTAGTPLSVRAFDSDKLVFTGDEIPVPGRYFWSMFATTSGNLVLPGQSEKPTGAGVEIRGSESSGPQPPRLGWLDLATNTSETSNIQLKGGVISLFAQGNQIVNSEPHEDGSSKMTVLDMTSRAVSDLGINGSSPNWSSSGKSVFYIVDINPSGKVYSSIARYDISENTDPVTVLDSVSFGYFSFSLSANDTHLGYIKLVGLDTRLIVVSLADTSDQWTSSYSGSFMQASLSPKATKMAYWASSGLTSTLMIARVGSSATVEVLQTVESFFPPMVYWYANDRSFLVQIERDVLKFDFESAESLNITNSEVLVTLEPGIHFMGFDEARGQLFYVSTEAAAPPPHHIDLTLNWGEELKRIAPPSK